MAKQLFLVFFIGKEQFAINTQDVIEILPLVNFTQIPKTENYVAGMMNFRGIMTPAIDLCMLVNQQSFQEKVCSRIIVIRNPFSAEFNYTGLIAEKVTNTLTLETDNFISHGLIKNNTRYLGSIAQVDSNEIQIIDLEKLLPDEVNNQPFANSIG